MRRIPAPTAAFVAENLGLPGNPTILCLRSKKIFRTFLDTNGFNVPKSRAFLTLVKLRNGLRNEFRCLY